MKMMLMNLNTGEETETHSFERMKLQTADGLSIEIIDNGNGFDIRTECQMIIRPVVGNMIRIEGHK